MNLIVCGDSWSAGAELRDHEQNFGQLLACRLNATLYNQSIDASSIPHLIIQLRTAIQQCDLAQPTKALFFLTSPDRDLIWSDILPRGTGFSKTHPPPHSKMEEILLNPNDPLHEHWYRKYYSHELANFRCNSSILALQTICRYHNIQDYYIWGWSRFKLWPEVDQTKFYNNGATRVFDFFTNDPDTSPGPEFNALCEYIWPNGGHPNQLGHQLIADQLCAWIADVH